MSHVVTTRDRIFLAAVDCFSQKNYKQCTMHEIASMVGIKPASVYKHFTSKEQILLDIFEYYKNNVHKYRTPVSEVINAASHRPPAKLLPMLFYRFGSAEERQIMVKIARIVVSMRHECEQAENVFWWIHIQEPIEYLNTVFFSLIMANRMPPIDYEALTLQVVAFAQLMLLLALKQGTDQALIEKQYVDGINMLAKMMENAGTSA